MAVIRSSDVDYRWLAVLAEFDERAAKLSEALGGSAGEGLCAARASALGLMVGDVEAALKAIRDMLGEYEGVDEDCGGDSSRGCWVCRPVTQFQTVAGEVIEIEEDDAFDRELRGEGVRMELVEVLQPMRGRGDKAKGVVVGLPVQGADIAAVDGKEVEKLEGGDE